MKGLFVLLAVLVVAAPAVAGTWDADKDWVCLVQSEVKTVKQFGWGLDGTQPTEYWGPEMERTGQKLAMRSKNVSGSQSKYRTDSNTVGWTWTAGVKTVLKLGIYCIDSTSSYPQIYIRGSVAGIKIRYDDVADAWLPAKTVALGAGSPSSLPTPQNAWHTIRVQLDGANWDVWLDGDVGQHMWGTVSGDSGSYVQFGMLGSGTDNCEFAVDRVVWGQGDDHIAPLSDDIIPEPGSIIALATGLVALVGLARRRR